MNRFIRFLMFSLIIIFYYEDINGTILNLRTGNTANTFAEAISQGVNVGDTLLLTNPNGNYNIGGAVTIPDSVVIIGNWTNPDSFPNIINDNQNYYMSLGDGVIFKKVTFKANFPNTNGILQVQSLKQVIFDQVVFEYLPSGKYWIRLNSSAKVKVENAIYKSSEGMFIYYWGDADTKLEVYNSTFYNINSPLFYDNNHNTSYPISIDGNIFHTVSSISNYYNVRYNVEKCVLYKTDATDINATTNQIDVDPRFISTNPNLPTDFKLSQFSPARDYVEWNTDLPNYDIAGNDREATKAGDVIDAGAWEYLDYDPPEFAYIQKFDVYYDSINRPDYQHARLEFNITIGPSDWDTILIKYNSPVDTNNLLIGDYPYDQNDGKTLFRISKNEIPIEGSQSKQDSIVYKDNGDGTYTIYTLRPLFIPKSVLDSNELDPRYIYGKGYAITLLISDDKGNWTTRNAVDSTGRKPLDKMQIMSLLSLTDQDTIIQDAGQTFDINTYIRLIDEQRPTDYYGSLNVIIWDIANNQQINFNYTGGNNVSSITIPFNAGTEANSEGIWFEQTGDFYVVLTTEDNLEFKDTIFIHQNVPPQLVFENTLGGDISEISLQDGQGVLRHLQLRLIRNDETTDPITVTLSFVSSAKGCFGTDSNNINLTTLILTYTGSDAELVQDFWVRLPLADSSKILAIMTTPDKPWVTDTLNIVDGEGMVLEFVVPLDSILEIYNSMSYNATARVYFPGTGVSVPGAVLQFSVGQGGALLTPTFGETDSSGKLSTNILFDLNKETIIRVSDANGSGLSDQFVFDANPTTVRYVDNDYVVQQNSGTLSDPDILTGFNSLTINLKAALKANGDEIPKGGNSISNENLIFDIVEGNATFTTASAINSGRRDIVTTDVYGEATTTLSYTPGQDILISVKAQRDSINVIRYIKINASNEQLRFIRDTVSREDGTNVTLTAEYLIDGNPISGVNLVFERVDNSEGQTADGPWWGSFVSDDSIASTDNNGLGSVSYTIQLAADWNRVKVYLEGREGDLEDTIVVIMIPSSPDEVNLLTYISDNSGTTDPLIFQAGSQGRLLVEILRRGTPMEGTIDSIWLSPAYLATHPNFRYSFDGVTWYAPGEPTPDQYTSTGYLSFYVTDTKADTITVYVSEKTSGIITYKTNIIVTPASVDPDSSIFYANPTNLYVYNTGVTPDQTTLTIILKDRFGNLITNKTVNAPTNTGSAIITPTSLITDINGRVQFTSYDTIAETVTYSVTVDGVTLTDQPTVTFNAGSPDAIGSQPVIIYPDTAVADGVDSIIIKVHLRDKYGNPIVGKTISDVGNITIGYSKSPTYILTPLQSVSDATGLLKWSLKDITAQFDTVKVWIEGSGYVPPIPVAVFIPGPPAKIVIENAPVGGTEVGNKTLFAGDTLALYATLYDKYGNRIGPATTDNISWSYIGDEPLWNLISPTFASNYTYFYPRKVGTGEIFVYWTSSDGSTVLTDTTGILTILGGSPSYVKVYTEHNQIETAGTPFNVKLVLYDKWDNIASYNGVLSFLFEVDTLGEAYYKYIEAQLPTTAVPFNFLNGESNYNGSFTLYSADVKYYLIATSGTITTDTTGSQITVIPGDYTKLKVLTGISGKTPFAEDQEYVIDVKSELPFHAAQFDNWYNYIKDTQAKWLLGTGNLKTESSNFYDQFGEVLITFRFNPSDSSIVLGDTLGTIKAEDPTSTSLSDTTGLIHVKPVPDHIIVLSNSLGNLSDSLYTEDTIYITAGKTLRLYSVAFDTFNVFMGNYTSQWYYHFKNQGLGLGPLASYYDFTLTKVDTGFVYEIYSNPLVKNDSTPVIVILPGEPAFIRVEVLSDTVVAGDTIPVQLTLIDSFGNVVNTPRGDTTITNLTFNIENDIPTQEPFNMSIIKPEGPFTFVRGVDTTYLVFTKASTPGEYPIVRVEGAGLESYNKDEVWVVPGDPYKILIMYSPNGTKEAGDTTITIDDSLTLYAVLFDKVGNNLGLEPSIWQTFNISPEFKADSSTFLKIGIFSDTTSNGIVAATPIRATIQSDVAENIRIISGKPHHYIIKVSEALFSGVPGYRGDTVAYNEGFNIKVYVVDRLGYVLTDYIGKDHLAFTWWLDRTQPVAKDSLYDFVNGVAIIKELGNEYPFAIQHLGWDTLIVYNIENTLLKGEGAIYAIDREPPVPTNAIAFDSNGDGFIDSIVVEFSEKIDSSKIAVPHAAALFDLYPDSIHLDNVTENLIVQRITVLDSNIISLIIGFNPDLTEDEISIIKPQTDIRPFIYYKGNILGEDLGIYDRNQNPAQSFKIQTDERVGAVIVSAFLDDICDEDIKNDTLYLTLSEDINLDNLNLLDPASGLKIITSGGDTVRFLRDISKYIINQPIGREIKIALNGAVDIKVGRDYVRLVPRQGFLDTTSYTNDVHPENRLVKIIYTDRNCVFELFRNIPNPVPIYYYLDQYDGNLSSIPPTADIGTVFKISTNSPVLIKADVYTVQGNYVNTLKMQVTQDMLEQFNGERVDFYFGAQKEDGTLTVIDRSYYSEGEFDIHNIPVSQRFILKNKKGRVVEAGPYIMKVYINNKYAGVWKIVIK